MDWTAQADTVNLKTTHLNLGATQRRSDQGQHARTHNRAVRAGSRVYCLQGSGLDGRFVYLPPDHKPCSEAERSTGTGPAHALSTVAGCRGEGLDTRPRVWCQKPEIVNTSPTNTAFLEHICLRQW